MTLEVSLAAAHRAYVAEMLELRALKGLGYVMSDTSEVFDGPRAFAACDYCSRVAIKPRATCDGCGAPLTVGTRQKVPTIIYDPSVFDDDLAVRQGFKGRLSEHVHFVS